MKARIALMTVLFLVLTVGTAGAVQTLLDPLTIPKFADPLPVAGDISVVNAMSTTNGGLGGATFTVTAKEFQSWILPKSMNLPSYVWGYALATDDTTVVRESYLGPVIVAQRNVPAYPEYLNELPLVGGKVQANLPFDLTLDWANPDDLDCIKDPITDDYTNILCGPIPYMGAIPIATHLHGGEVSASFDGGPDAWFTPGNMAPDYTQITGAGFPGSVYEYPNEQQESTIWFHDHALGITRLNVYAGLAGVYPIIDPNNNHAPMPAFPAYDIPLIIQDRSFDTTGEIFYNLASNPQPNPTVHPSWIPEFIGDTIVVNGKTWPYLNVEPRQYRFRLVNGSNARFYTLSMNKGAKFLAIATDDGYLQTAVKTNSLIIGPGERYEVIVDFKNVSPGKLKKGKQVNVTMFNAAATPFPAGGPVVLGLTDTVMQFRVMPGTLSTVPDTTIVAGTPIRDPNTPILPIVNGHNPANGSITRQLTLNEVIGAGGPLELVVNNSKFNLAGLIPGSTTPMGRETELPAVGDTEIWEIINISADAHPMHLHLTSFQVLDRTPFDMLGWTTQYDALLLSKGVHPGGGPPNPYSVANADGAIGGNPAINAFKDPLLTRPPLPYEMGWKDTVIAYPGEVTRIVVRWNTTDTLVTQYDPSAPPANNYPFDPTALAGDPDNQEGVGYVWHCHIIDHEDNEMMRNYVVGAARQPVN